MRNSQRCRCIFYRDDLASTSHPVDCVSGCWKVVICMWWSSIEFVKNCRSQSNASPEIEIFIDLRWLIMQLLTNIVQHLASFDRASCALNRKGDSTEKSPIQLGSEPTWFWMRSLTRSIGAAAVFWWNVSKCSHHVLIINIPRQQLKHHPSRNQRQNQAFYLVSPILSLWTINLHAHEGLVLLLDFFCSHLCGCL